MHEDAPEGPFAHLIDEFGSEYSPLEVFLVCIMDAEHPNGVASSVPKKRITRLDQAMNALTGRATNRVDEPDGEIAKGLYRMAELEYEDYVSQLKPEFGGPKEPDWKERTTAQLAEEAARQLGIPKSKIEILRKKYSATYGDDRRARSIQYELVHRQRLSGFDPSKELAMLNDFRQVAAILSKYGITMNFDRVFWRSIGKDTEIPPRTKV